MEEIIKKWKPITKKLGVGYIIDYILQRERIIEGSYSDDVVIFARNEQELQIIKQSMKAEWKTKVMIIGENRENINIEIDGENINVNHIQYLGVMIDEKSSQEA